MVEGVDLEYLHILDVFYAFVGVFIQQGFEHQARLGAVSGEVVALFDVAGAFGAGERWLVEGGVADEVEDVHFLVYCGFEVGEYDALFGELGDNGALLVGCAPLL